MIGGLGFHLRGDPQLNVSALFFWKIRFFARKCADVACNFQKMVYSMSSYGVFNH